MKDTWPVIPHKLVVHFCERRKNWNDFSVSRIINILKMRLVEGRYFVIALKITTIFPI
jgi:hypothetical protein